MNSIPVMPGVWDPDYYGETQHAGATHIVQETSRKEQLNRLRHDIRTFKQEQDIGEGHVTVCWSASVERPCEEHATAAELLEAIERDDKACVSPSLLYAVAAILEGCSFVNGGSQNTVQPALLELAEGTAAYVLGTDFKAGQTKAKTAIVEYLRTLGLRPRTIASYNHLGNNDMKNLLSPKTWKAKERVKTDVFGPWQEGEQGGIGGVIDHKVAVLYTEQMGDEKRDTVEYTSEAFMGCEHTMLTYTRCMDSALCVPLMIDSAILCDHLLARGASADAAAKALAYLFKLNEGAAIGVDPGFFNQSATLLSLLESLPAEPAGRPLPTERETLDAAAGGAEGSVLCVGVSCVDMMLMRANEPTSREAIAEFDGCDFAAGGSVSNTAAALRALEVDVGVLTCIGEDVHGKQLSEIYESQGVDTSLLMRHGDVSTSLAVLPVFRDGGGRGCWVDLSANGRLTPEALLGVLRGRKDALSVVRSLHVGYPHLLSGLQGAALNTFLREAGALIHEIGGAGMPLLSVDVNGATLGAIGDADEVLAPALPMVDMLHANLEEACHLVGIEAGSVTEAKATERELREKIAEPLFSRGVAVVAITLGGSGAFVATTDDLQRLERGDGVLARTSSGWRGQSVLLPALPVEGELNCNGAGDAFTAGLIAAMLWRNDLNTNAEPVSLEQAALLALASARQRVDTSRRGINDESAAYILTQDQDARSGVSLSVTS